ncbi:MAG TPA: hypothetical protein VG432_15240 [Gemmatimonadaceae bacterium]|nr:hypothetical protein [Gemmatimonadaceae bacterium]
MAGRALAAGRIRAVLAAALLSAGAAGCAHTARPRVLLPPEAIRAGLTESDWLLRRSLASGGFDSAAALVAPDGALAPDDALLASLYRGSTLYYAGKFGTSGYALDAAAVLADDRFTKSISKNLLALISNDGALPYEPSQTERLMMNYYGMLDYLRRGDPMGGAVEARRISALLESFDTRKDSVDVRTRAVLNYLAGATFEAAGEKTDADVSYRVARALVGDSVLPFPLTGEAKRKAVATATRIAAARSTPDGGAGQPAPPRKKGARATVPPPMPTGEVVVVVEHGFIAHRVPRMLLVPVTESEFEKFGSGPAETVAAAAAISLRTAAFLALQPGQFMWRDSDDDGTSFTVRDSSTVPIGYLMPVAWSTLRRPYHPPWTATLVVDSVATKTFGVTADLCNAIANDFRRQRGPALARGIARAGIKLALARTAEKKAEEKHGEFAGAMAKWGMNALNVVTERPDLRQWRLLPGELSIVRMILPAGTHDLAIDYASRPGEPPRRLTIGPTEIVAGKVAFATTRIWDDGVTLPTNRPLAISR